MKTKVKTKISELFKNVWNTILLPEMVLLPGNLAFFLVLAIIPTMTLITYAAGVMNLSMDFIYEFLEEAFSPEMASLMLSTSTAANAGLKLSIILIICYYIASNGTNSVIVTSNTIYGIKNGSWFKRRLKAIVMAIIFVLLITFLLLIPVFGEKIVMLISMVNLNTEITGMIQEVFKYLQSPVLVIVLFLVIKIIYIMSPDKKVKQSNTNYGAIFTTISWVLLTKAFSYYVNNIANYRAFYGGLTSVCVLMIWFYFLAYFFVIGMSLNHQREIKKGE